jgi:hypothetical protein
MTFDNLDDRDMDRLCWLLVSTRNRFYRPDETAEECIEALEIEDDDERAKGNEHGYHRGMFISRNMFMEQLYGYGINVLARANRYTHLNRTHDMEFRLDDEPDFYRAVEGGAEVKAITSPLYDEIEIESLSWDDPYVPAGADE